jgi:hypothetical protein
MDSNPDPGFFRSNGRRNPERNPNQFLRDNKSPNRPRPV